MVDISIILTVYNKEKFVLKSLKSVLKQSYVNWELIIINDGSTDRSEELILSEIKNEDRIVYVSQENQGVSSARNKGLFLAKGKFITFLDADDEWEITFLEEMIRKIGDCNICYCGHYTFNGNSLKKAREVNFKEGDILSEYLYNKNTPHTNSWLIRNSFIKQYNLSFRVGVKWGEDMEFFSKILFHDKNVKSVKKYLTIYHNNVEGSLSRNTINKIEEDILWMNDLIKYFKKYEEEEKRNKSLCLAINSYRLPASIIYRIISNKDKLNRETIKDLLEKHYKILNELKIVNGFRSLKVYFFYFILKF